MVERRRKWFERHVGRGGLSWTVLGSHGGEIPWDEGQAFWGTDCAEH